MVSMKTLCLFAAFSAVALGGIVRRGADHEPSFMEGLDDATKAKFKAIFHDHSLKGESKDAALLKLATSVLKPDQLAEFKTHQAEWAKHRAEYEANYAKLSPNARKAADQLKTIWEDDKMNHDAKKAKKAAIMKTLSDAEQKEIEALLPHHHHMPPFMHGLPKETQDKFKAIWHDNSLKGDAKSAALTKLAQSVLKPEQMTQFKEHMTKMTEWRAKMDAKLAKLSPNARKAADAMHALWQNDDLSWTQKETQQDAIKAGLSAAEKAELEALHHHSFDHGKKSEEQ